MLDNRIAIDDLVIIDGDNRVGILKSIVRRVLSDSTVVEFLPSFGGGHLEVDGSRLKLFARKGTQTYDRYFQGYTNSEHAKVKQTKEWNVKNDKVSREQFDDAVKRHLPPRRRSNPRDNDQTDLREDDFFSLQELAIDLDRPELLEAWTKELADFRQTYN